MPATESTMRPLGSRCPDFSLTDVVSGAHTGPAMFSGKPLLVAFICNHCPFVVHVRPQLAALSKEAAARGYGCIFVCSNDLATHPQDGPGPMAAEARAAGYACPYVFDETQNVARAFGAACTPDFFLFDAAHALAYRGQLDDSRPNNGKPVTGADLRAALDAVLAGKAPADTQKPSIGCNIKWKAG